MFDSLNSMTMSRLKKICQDEHIGKHSKLLKKPLVKHIMVHRIKKIINTGVDQLKKIE